MTTEPLLPPPALPPPAPGRFVRAEYLGFEDVAEHREFRLRLCSPDGSSEFRVRIASAAFGDGRVRLQDGPDVCYQKLLRAVALGETASPDVITIDDAELASYHEAHTPKPRHRSPRPPSLSTPVFTPPRPARTPFRRLPIAPPVPNDGEPGLEEGQRVSHAVFGVGVTAASSRGRTVVRFDEEGPKTFVTSMLKLEVLSAPHTWETGPRGKNRQCEVVPAPAAT